MILNRRSFLKILAPAAPLVFVPQLIKVNWGIRRPYSVPWNTDRYRLIPASTLYFDVDHFERARGTIHFSNSFEEQVDFAGFKNMPLKKAISEMAKCFENEFGK